MKENGIDVCEVKESHPGIVKEVEAKMPDDYTLDKLSNLYHVFSDSVRLKIICALFEKPMCVCDLSESLQQTQSNISHHLAILKSSQLVSATKSGKQVIYALKDEHVKEIFEMGLEHILEKE